MSGIVVVTPGFLTTVQDLGRPGHAASGVSASGAADPIALRAGNRLAGNDPGAAALEMTLLGGTFVFEQETTIALTGAEARATKDGVPIPGWTAIDVRAGTTIACAALRDGARAYLCVRGGITTPPLLGSRSTHLASGLGGHLGRALRTGDRLSLGEPARRAPRRRAADPASIPAYRGGPFRVTRGPQAAWFQDAAQRALLESDWRVAEASDRMGIRLEGPALAPIAPRELVTEGVALGALQVPADGRPIILFVEHQTTGGYPKIANVIRADLPRLGQLRPRDTLRFELIECDDAVALAREQDAALERL